MAAGVALTKAKITGPGLDSELVGSVLVRGNRLQVRDKTTTLLEDSTVTSVVRTDQRTWTVTTDAGAFTVIRQRGCGCGG